MTSPAFLTSVTTTYLPYARVLAQSLRKFHPNAPFYACVADGEERERDALDGEIRWLSGLSLKLPGWRRLAFQYQTFELVCALKAFALERMLQDHDQVIYLDADILVLGSLHELLHALDDCSILLTPHLEVPLPKEAPAGMAEEILRFGVYNMGFLGLRRTDDAHRCLRWWQAHVRERCVDARAAGIFFDQVVMNAAPALFGGVRIERSPVFNVANWNLLNRPLSRDPDGRYLVAGAPVAFFHFSTFNPETPRRLNRSQRLDWLAQYPCLEELLRDYVKRLDEAGRLAQPKPEYRFARMSDGMPIPIAWRRMVRAGLPELSDLEDPFDAQWIPLFHALERKKGKGFPEPMQAPEVVIWRTNYERLARSFPVNVLLWLRRRLLGLADPTETPHA